MIGKLGSGKLIIFCDSSKDCYGFCCYLVSEIDGIKSNLVFAKSKVAPGKSPSLPTLELLSVHLASKCLISILDSFVNIEEIVIAMDAQIVLSWILTENVKAKNILAKNKVKDISLIRQNILSRYKLNIKFRYIPTAENPADLVSRGVSYTNLNKNWDFWAHGPQFLVQIAGKWPEKPLGCLSKTSQLALNTTCQFFCE